MQWDANARAHLELEEIEYLERSVTNLRDCLFIGLFFHLACYRVVAGEYRDDELR